MITTPIDDQESVLVREIIKLNKTLEKSNSWWRAVLRGVFYAVGSVVGLAAVAFVSGLYLWRVAVNADLGSKLEKTVNATIEKQIKNQVTSNAQKIQVPPMVDENLLNTFLKNQR